MIITNMKNVSFTNDSLIGIVACDIDSDFNQCDRSGTIGIDC